MSLRARTIRAAYAEPTLRPLLLPLLRVAMEHPSEEALKEYLKEHPGADPSKHTVAKPKEDGGSSKPKPEPAYDKDLAQSFENHRIMHSRSISSEESASLRRISDSLYGRGTIQKGDHERLLGWLEKYVADLESMGKKPDSTIKKVMKGLSKAIKAE